MSHSRDIDSFLKKSGSESFSYKRFPSEQAGQESPWSIIDSVSAAKPTLAQEPSDEYGPVSMTRPTQHQKQQVFDPMARQSQASEPDRYFQKTQFSEPEYRLERERRPEPEPRQDTGQRFGHLFSQVTSSSERLAQNTPLKALLLRIAS